MKEIVAAADGPIWTGYEVAGVPGRARRLLRELQGKREWDIRMAFGIWKKEHGKWRWKLAEEKMMRSLEGGSKLWILYRADKKHIERNPDRVRISASWMREVYG